MHLKGRAFTLVLITAEVDRQITGDHRTRRRPVWSGDRTPVYKSHGPSFRITPRTRRRLPIVLARLQQLEQERAQLEVERATLTRGGMR